MMTRLVAVMITDASVDESQKEVTVKVGPMYADGFGIDINVDKVNTVDLSGNFQHDDQDLSVQQPDGTFVATQADIDQLTQLGQNYLIEHKYGHINVSTTLTYKEMSGINADMTQLSLYDKLYVRFKQYDIQETAEITGTVFDCLSHHYQQMQDAQAWIASGGSAILQFVDASGNQTYKNPVEIRAVNSEGSLRFNNHGLGFFSPSGNTRTAIRSDGKINAEEIDTGVVKALNVQSLVVNSSVVTRVGGTTLTVGAINDTLPPSVSGAITGNYGFVVTNGDDAVITNSKGIWLARGGGVNGRVSSDGVSMISGLSFYNGHIYDDNGMFLKNADGIASIQEWIRRHWSGKSGQWDFM